MDGLGSLLSTLNTISDHDIETTSETKTVVKDFCRKTSPDLPTSSNAEVDNDIMIEVDTEPGDVEVPVTRKSLLGFEILKSVVYGGLMELIVSLSVVASAVSSNATTLIIMALSLGTLIGGVLVIGLNLWNLKDDCKMESSTEETDKEATDKYNELFGRVNYFPLHALIATLSFLVFGMVPPMAYGYSFYKTNDKDYSVVVVVIASLLCIILLATFKAYINRCTVLGYFKTVVYYITIAVSISGVSYVVGNLVTRLMEELGLFDASSGRDVSFPRVMSSFASF